MATSSPLSTYSSLLNKLKASKTSSSAPAPTSTSASTPAPASTTSSSGSAIGGTMPGIGGGVAPGQSAPGTVLGMARPTITPTRSTRRSY